MRSGDINELLKRDEKARAYFDLLPKGLRDGLSAHGDGINTLEELKHFADIMNNRGH